MDKFNQILPTALVWKLRGDLVAIATVTQTWGSSPRPVGSQMIINNCPWCGTKLPESKRDLWFDTLESIGYDDPWEQNIPQKYKSKLWRQS